MATFQTTLTLSYLNGADASSRSTTSSWLARASAVAQQRDGFCALHAEPRSYAAPPAFRVAAQRVPAAWFTRLQRFAAALLIDPASTPAPLPPGAAGDAAACAAIDSLLDRGVVTHLLCHTTDGFFLPVDLARPVFDDCSPLPSASGFGVGGGGGLSSLFRGGGAAAASAAATRGGWIGSSAGLLDELVAMSPALGIAFTSSAGRGALRGLRGGGGFDLSAATVALLNGDLVAALRSAGSGGDGDGDGDGDGGQCVSKDIAQHMFASALSEATERIASPRAVGGGLRGLRVLAERRQRAEDRGSSGKEANLGDRETAAAAGAEEEGEGGGFRAERAMWFILFDVALLSMKHSSAIFVCSS